MSADAGPRRKGRKAQRRRARHGEMSSHALELVAARFKVLSDATRLRLLQLVLEGESSVSELADAVESTQPNVSKHLKTLQDTGFLSRRQNGNTVYYSIADTSVFDLCEIVCSSLATRFTAHANALSGDRSRITN